jgi:hypothetical protein
MVMAEVYDSGGRLLKVGDVCFMDEGTKIRWEITDIVPILSPGAPPNAVKVIAVAHLMKGPLQAGVHLPSVHLYMNDEDKQAHDAAAAEKAKAPSIVLPGES